MANERIQKATEWDKQSAALLKQYRNVEALTSAGNYCWQPKYDGVHCIIDTTERTAVTREGTPLPSIQHVVDYLSTAVGGGQVFQGEVWVPNTPFKDISGAARRHAVQPHLGVVLYDWHHHEFFVMGEDPQPYRARRARLLHELAKVNGYPHILIGGSCYCADYPIGGWQALAQEYIRDGGYDGLILRDLNAPWVAGICRNGALIKVKPSVTLDLRCNGVIQGEGKHAGKLGAISVSFNGVNTCVGTGFSDQEREDFWEAAVYGANREKHRRENPIGKIVEVECMCINTNNTLREPRFKAVRWDKSRSTDEVDA